MEKEGHMECKKSPSGHRYYVNKNHSKITLIRPKAEPTMEEIVAEFNFLSEHGIVNKSDLEKWEERKTFKGRLKRLGQFFRKNWRNLPRLLLKTLRYVMMTPIMIVLFVLNIVKSIFGIFISWIIFKGILSIVCVSVIAIHSELTNTYVGYNSFSDIPFIHWLFPNSVITYWWEWAMLIIFTLMTAYTLTFTPRRIELESY